VDGSAGTPTTPTVHLPSSALVAMSRVGRLCDLIQDAADTVAYDADVACQIIAWAAQIREIAGGLSR
jgi:hypothetical protein